MALTGYDAGAKARILLHSFITDLMLDKEPWLNTTTVCTFPEPWLTGAQAEKFIQKMSSRDDDPEQTLTEPDQSSHLPYPSNLNPYTGVYGDFYYGNVTIFSDDSELYFQYGTIQSIQLVTTGSENVFLAATVPSDDDWPLRTTVAFGVSEEGLQQFDLCQVSFDDFPTIFIRDLKKSDAPEPPNPNECS